AFVNVWPRPVTSTKSSARMRSIAAASLRFTAAWYCVSSAATAAASSAGAATATIPLKSIAAINRPHRDPPIVSTPSVDADQSIPVRSRPPATNGPRHTDLRLDVRTRSPQRSGLQVERRETCDNHPMHGVKWPAASMAAIVMGAFVGAAPTSMGTLADRPLTGALTHPAIGYYARPTHDLVADLNH